MSSLETLWELQEVRKMYFQLKKEEAAISRGERIGSMEDELSQAEETLEALNREIADAKKELKKREMDSQDLNQKKEGLQEELYSGKANAKELSNLQQRLDKTEEDLGIYEEDIVKLSVRIDELSSEEEEVREKTAEIETALSVEKANDEVVMQDLREQISKLKEKHDALVKKIDPRTLKVFNQKFKQHSITTMAGVSSGICAGCNVHLSRIVLAEVKKRDGLVACENCGRILYYRP